MSPRTYHYLCVFLFSLLPRYVMHEPASCSRLQPPRKLGVPFVEKGDVDQSFDTQIGTLLSTDYKMVFASHPALK